jgi:membrane protease YdiL (CAAX protease family)
MNDSNEHIYGNEPNESTGKKPFKSLIIIIFTIILLLGIPKLSGLIADQFNYDYIDPDNTFAWFSVHHIAQMIIFMIIIAILIKIKNVDFQLGKGDTKEGLEILRKFTLYFFIYNLVAYLIIYLSGGLVPFFRPMTAQNIFGYLGFQLLLSGPSEELIFRAFAMTIFTTYIPGKLGSSKISKSNFLAAIIFAAAHVGFTFVPFSISYDPMQLFLSFGLGLLYGLCYEKAKSVYYPALMHSISNVIMVGSTIILTYFLF